jgi:hypothetical protein
LQKTDCDLGALHFIPYVGYHSSLFCSLPLSAAQMAGIYFFIGLSILALCHVLYRQGRTRPQKTTWPARQRIAPIAGFWILFFDWLFGLEGSRGSLEGLTSSGFLLYFFVSLGIAFTHLFTMYTRYRPKP